MGHSWYDQDLKKSLERSRVRKIRTYYRNGSVLNDNDYRILVDSFDKKQYLLYEHYHHTYGTPGRKRQVMLEKIISDNVTGPVKQLAEIRVNDLYKHQKLLQNLRNRWTDIKQHKASLINNNSEKFWRKMARDIVRRSKQTNKKLYKKWDGPDNLKNLIEYLKKLFDEQKGVCKLTNLPLELSLNNENKCSADRIDSKKGYIPGNIWLVVLWANRMKLDTALDEFLLRVGLINKVNNA